MMFVSCRRSYLRAIGLFVVIVIVTKKSLWNVASTNGTFRITHDLESTNEFIQRHRDQAADGTNSYIYNGIQSVTYTSGMRPGYYKHDDNTTMKTILLYNSYYHYKDYRFGLGVDPFTSKCGRSDCQTVLDHDRLNT